MKKQHLARLVIFLSLTWHFGFLAFGETPSAGTTNAATYYKKANSMLTELPEDFIKKAKDIIDKGWINNNKELKEILIKNQAAINEFKKATKIRNYDFTFGEYIKKTATTPMPKHLYGGINLIRLVILEGRLYEKENRFDLALENYLCALKFANHLGQQNDLLSKIAEIIIQRLAYVPLKQYVNREDINIQNCQALLDNLIFLRSEKIGLEKASEDEKEMQKNTIRTIGEEAKKKGEYDENFYQRFYQEFDSLIDDYFGYLITYSRENKPEKCKEQFKQFEDELERQTKPLTLAWEALKGKMGFSKGINSPLLSEKQMVLLAVSQFASGIIITRQYVSLTELNLLITASAIKVYQLKNGKIPESLQALMPDYLTKLPEDPFNDFKPLIYKRIDKGWIVYSFGPDKEDNDASMEYAEGSSDKKSDIIFSSF